MARYRGVIGKRKGFKVRLVYPSQSGGQISYTFASIAAAKRHKKQLSRWAKSRVRAYDAVGGIRIKL